MAFSKDFNVSNSSPYSSSTLPSNPTYICFFLFSYSLFPVHDTCVLFSIHCNIPQPHTTVFYGYFNLKTHIQGFRASIHKWKRTCVCVSFWSLNYLTENAHFKCHLFRCEFHCFIFFFTNKCHCAHAPKLCFHFVLLLKYWILSGLVLAHLHFTFFFFSTGNSRTAEMRVLFRNFSCHLLQHLYLGAVHISQAIHVHIWTKKKQTKPNKAKNKKPIFQKWFLTYSIFLSIGPILFR